MPYNGSGGFAVYTPGTPYVTGTVISSTVANNVNSDFATGLSTAITKDGQTTITANIPMSNFKLTGLPAGSATGDSLSWTNFNAWTSYTPTVSADSGTYGAATVTLAKYKLVNKTLFLMLRVSATVSSGTPAEFRVTYPGSASGANNTGYVVSAITTGGATEIGLVLPTNSTYLSFQRLSGTFSAGSGCYFCGIVEIA